MSANCANSVVFYGEGVIGRENHYSVHFSYCTVVALSTFSNYVYYFYFSVNIMTRSNYFYKIS